ncbi:hypothetical protein ACLB2K_069680 [Fragaria x ananassa]
MGKPPFVLRHCGLRSKTKECRSIRAVPLKFRQADPVEFGELVAGRGLNAEEGTRPSLHKLVGVWSRSPDEPKAGRNQSLPRLIRLAPWHGSAAWAKCGGRRARPKVVDLKRCASVCKTWRNAIVPGRVRPDHSDMPWTISWNHSCDSRKTSAEFSDFWSTRTFLYITKTQEPGRESLLDGDFRASKHGWLLLLSAVKNSDGSRSSMYFFYNPFCNKIIEELPQLNWPGGRRVITTFTAAPTSPDCVIFVMDIEASGIYILNTSKFRVALQDWTVIEDCSTTFLNINSGFYDGFSYSFKLLECDGQVLLAAVHKYDDISRIHIIGFDWSQKASTPVRSLGERVLFWSRLVTFAVPAVGDSRWFANMIFWRSDREIIECRYVYESEGKFSFALQDWTMIEDCSSSFLNINSGFSEYSYSFKLLECDGEVFLAAVCNDISRIHVIRFDWSQKVSTPLRSVGKRVLFWSLLGTFAVPAEGESSEFANMIFWRSEWC